MIRTQILMEITTSEFSQIKNKQTRKMIHHNSKFLLQHQKRRDPEAFRKNLRTKNLQSNPTAQNSMLLITRSQTNLSKRVTCGFKEEISERLGKYFGLFWMTVH